MIKRLAIALTIAFAFSSTSLASTNVMHTVQEGDTLWSLSKNYKTTVNTLLQTNSKTKVDLYKGDLLKITTIPQTINLFVDNKKLKPDANPYLENSRTFVPIRFIAEALNVSVTWDSPSRTAIISNSTKTIRLPIGSKIAYVNGKSYTLDAPIQLHENRTFVPVRFVSEILGCEVDWDASNYSVLIASSTEVFQSSSSMNDQNLYWLSRIVEAEAKGESYQGKLAVSNVVINRVKDATFPNTIKDVIFDTQFGVQFTPVKNGAIYNTPSTDSIAAAKDALNGNNNIQNCLYFVNPAKATQSWIQNNRELFGTIGNHDFYH